MLTRKLRFDHFVRRIFLALVVFTYAAAGYAAGWGDTKTYCFGRFLIDVPETALLAHQADIFMVGVIESELSNMDAKEFSKKMTTLEEGLRAKTRQDGFQLQTRISKAPNTKVFQTKDKLRPTNEDTYGFEAYRWVNDGVIFSIQRHDSDQSKIDSALQRLETDLLPKLQARKPNEIPNKPGFCIDNGFIVDDGQTPQREYVHLSFKFKEWPDVRVTVEASSGGVPKPSLEARLKKSRPLPVITAEGAKEIKNLRKGKRDVGPLQGEEILEAFPTDRGYLTHHFVWDTQGKLDSATEPAFYFELATGVIFSENTSPRMVHPSLTDKQAIELFDRIVNSIRLRPTSPGKSSDAGAPNSPNPATPKRLPLKSKATSASNCPQTGVWECAPDTPGIAEHRRFIEAGRPMPYGLAQRPARGLGRFIGMQEDDAVEITWTLVAYDKSADANGAT